MSPEREALERASAAWKGEAARWALMGTSLEAMGSWLRIREETRGRFNSKAK